MSRSGWSVVGGRKREGLLIFEEKEITLLDIGGYIRDIVVGLSAKCNLGSACIPSQ